MRAVYKQTLQHTAEPQRFVLRGFEKVVHVALQHENVNIWFLVDPESNYYDSRTFQVFGTGDPTVPNDAQFLGTVQTPPWVWHVFEIPTAEEDPEFLDSGPLS